MKKSGRPGVSEGTRKLKQTGSDFVRTGKAPAAKRKLPQPMATIAKPAQPAPGNQEHTGMEVMDQL